jgi:hypothetical protein
MAARYRMLRDTIARFHFRVNLMSRSSCQVVSVFRVHIFLPQKLGLGQFDT